MLKTWVFSNCDNIEAVAKKLEWFVLRNQPESQRSQTLQAIAELERQAWHPKVMVDVIAGFPGKFDVEHETLTYIPPGQSLPVPYIAVLCRRYCKAVAGLK